MTDRSDSRTRPLEPGAVVTAPMPPPMGKRPHELADDLADPKPAKGADDGPEVQAPIKLGGQTFKFRRVLGRGGMAEVFLADRIGPGGFARKVVVKKILPERAADPLYVQRFIREASLAAQFNHPSIVEILELGNVGTDYYIVMEYVDGRNLHDVTKRLREREQRFPMPLAARIVADVASALHYAHNFMGDDGAKRRIVHRDVSTTNIMVSFAGQVKLVDFGLAKDIDAQSLTMGDEILGKPLYMAPECLRGGKPSTSWDVYALGVVLYILLTGRAPYEPGSGSGGMAKLIHDIVSVAPPPLNIYFNDIPEALKEITLKCMAKKPEARPESAGDLQSALESYLANAPPLNTSMLASFVADLFDRDPVGSDPNVGSRDLGSRDLKSRDLSVSTNDRSRSGVDADLVAVAMREPERGPWGKVLVGLAIFLAFFVGLGFGFRKEVGAVWHNLRGPSAEELAQQARDRERPVEDVPVPVAVTPGVINVECNTMGYVSIDGRRIAMCPINPVRVQPGKHTVSFEEKTRTRTKEVVVEEGQTATVSFLPQGPAQPRQPRIINPTRE